MINWKVRIKNKLFWLAIIPAVLLLAQSVCAVFGVSISTGEVADKLIDVVNAVFVVLSIVGVVADPTTHGLEDSDLAMTYEEPKRK